MKALQFTIPVVPDKTVILQEDIIPQFYPYLHRHKEAQLVWVLKGEGTLIAENSMHLFKPNDIFYVAPNQSHVFKSTVVPVEEGEDENQVHTISIFFDPNGNMFNLLQLPELVQLNTFLKEFRGGFRLPEVYFEKISQRMLKMRSTDGLDQMLHFLHLMRVLSKMSVKPERLSTIRNEYITEGEGLRMGNIYNYILQHYQRGLTLEDVAAEAHLTPQAFCRYFKKHTGVTFVSFLNEMRVSEACKKLTRGDYENISSIAYHCGFNSITNFNRVFKSVAGTSPKEYLMKYRKNVQ